jgi:hypothetical protein
MEGLSLDDVHCTGRHTMVRATAARTTRCLGTYRSSYRLGAQVVIVEVPIITRRKSRSGAAASIIAAISPQIPLRI